jgi:DNA-binding response OmpR family regulator
MANNTLPTPIILLIEDDVATRELYQRELRTAFQVWAATIEADILHAAVNPSVALIVLGLDTPRKKELCLLEQLGQLMLDRRVPIIAYSTSDDRRQASKFALTEYLVQPVLPSVLLEKARLYLQNWPAYSTTDK